MSGGGSSSRRMQSADENGSSHGIIYPEDLELQSDDRSDKEIRVGVTSNPIGEGNGNGSGDNSYKYGGRKMDKLRLGLKPTVRTEIKVGSPAPQAWGAGGGVDRGIEVKRDFMMISRDRETSL